MRRGPAGGELVGGMPAGAGGDGLGGAVDDRGRRRDGRRAGGAGLGRASCGRPGRTPPRLLALVLALLPWVGTSVGVLSVVVGVTVWATGRVTHR